MKQQILKSLTNSVMHRNKRFYNRHKNESCYIFGNGVSIKYFDLEEFSDRTSISCNNLFFHRQFDSLNVQYYFSGHPFFYYPFWKNPYSNNFVKNPLGMMFKNQIKKYKKIEFFLNISNYFSFSSPNVNYLYHFKTKFNGYENVLLHETFNSMSGSLQAMLGIALNLGFSKITLVGCDYTHNPGLALHFFEHGGGEKYFREAPFIEEYLKSATKFADIETVTIDDTFKGHCLNSISYKKFTGKEPIYKENNSILELDTLSKLNQCEMQYKIYP